MLNLIPFIFLASIFSACSTNQPVQREKHPEKIKINWLENIKSTTRISSDHYSDFVLDKNGNSYIACFFTENSIDFIYIVKISPDGKIIWETTQLNKGRATAITIDKEENIWVSGFYSGLMDFGKQKSEDPTGSSLFLAQFNPEGECLKIISSAGGAIGFNIHANQNGDIILNGTCGEEFQLGDKKIKKENGLAENYFIAVLDKNGNCKSLRYFPLYISRIRSDREDNFYFAGRFNQPFQFDGFEGFTKDHYDNDAFLLKMDKTGKTEWIKQYGKFGNTKYGYRSEESFSDMVTEENGNITVIALSEKDYPSSSINLLEKDSSLKTVIITFDKNGNILKEKTIAQHAESGSIQTIAKNNKKEYFLTFTVKSNSTIEGQAITFTGNFRSVILKYNSNWKLLDRQLPANETDALYRVGNSFNDQVYYSGHFRNQIEWEEYKIENDGQHSLFMMNLK